MPEGDPQSEDRKNNSHQHFQAGEKIGGQGHKPGHIFRIQFYPGTPIPLLQYITNQATGQGWAPALNHLAWSAKHAGSGPRPSEHCLGVPPNKIFLNGLENGHGIK